MIQNQVDDAVNEFLTVGRAAEMLGVSPWTLRNWDKAGKLKTARHPRNGYRIYRRDDLAAILEPAGLRISLRERLTPRFDFNQVGRSAHLVQFYENDSYLVASVSRFIGAALASGDGAIVIATPAHRQALHRKLRARGLDLAGLRESGQYVPLDAAETLAKFM